MVKRPSRAKGENGFFIMPLKWPISALVQDFGDHIMHE